MSEILFISETELDQALSDAIQELNSYQHSVSLAIKFDKAIDYLKAKECNTVLINAPKRKFEAYQLSKEIKELFRGAVRVLIYSNDSSVNEASKFGLVNAEVEDANSIVQIVDKLPKENKRDFIVNEKFFSIYALDKEEASTEIALMLAYVLSKNGVDSLLLESSNDNNIEERLGIGTKAALLDRDRSKETDLTKDLDWFLAYVSENPLFARSHYLHLFANKINKLKYLQEQKLYAAKLAKDLKEFIQDTEQSSSTAVAENLYAIASTLESHGREINGKSHHLFDEIIHTGSKLCNYFICNLGSDLYSSVNQQLLYFSNQILVLIKDQSSSRLKEKYIQCKQELETNFTVQCQAVFLCEAQNYNEYKKLSESDWLELLGEKPILISLASDLILRLEYQQEKTVQNSALYQDLENYLTKTGLKTKTRKENKSLLKFLTTNS